MLYRVCKLVEGQAQDQFITSPRSIYNYLWVALYKCTLYMYANTSSRLGCISLTTVCQLMLWFTMVMMRNMQLIIA